MQSTILKRTTLLPRTAVSLNVEVLPGNPDKHILFLHGLFGKGNSFQFLAKAKKLQQAYTCHMVDMRNHGHSDWHATINYTSLAEDVHQYMRQSGLASMRNAVSLVGHSLGGKTAIKVASMYPQLIDRLVSLDASPVDRTKYPHLNGDSQRMVEDALTFSEHVQGQRLTKTQASKLIDEKVQDQILKSALLFNLKDDGTFGCNLRAIYENQDAIYGYEPSGTFEGPTLLLNGERSFQREILDDKKYYNESLPRVENSDIIMVEGAGHGLHFEKPALVRKLLHSFLLRQ